MPLTPPHSWILVLDPSPTVQTVLQLELARWLAGLRVRRPTGRTFLLAHRANATGCADPGVGPARGRCLCFAALCPATGHPRCLSGTGAHHPGYRERQARGPPLWLPGFPHQTLQSPGSDPGTGTGSRESRLATSTGRGAAMNALFLPRGPPGKPAAPSDKVALEENQGSCLWKD